MPRDRPKDRRRKLSGGTAEQPRVGATGEQPRVAGPATAARPKSRGRGGPPRRRPEGARPKQPGREVQRLRLITLAFVTLVLLGALPGFFLIKQATRDPAFRAMDELALPGWASQRPADSAAGNRWCVQACRVRQRDWESGRELAPTLAAYQEALRDAGWKAWHVEGCPARHVRGNYSCWRREEYTLDLWIRTPDCARKRGGTAPSPAAGERCPKSIVTVVIRNAGADRRLR